MADDLSAGVKIGMTLIILCALLAIVLALLSIMKNITNQGASTLQSGVDQMLATRFDDYDQKIVSGTVVISSIKLFEGQPVALVTVTTKAKASTSTNKGGFNYGAVLVGFTKESNLSGGSGPAGVGYLSNTVWTPKESTDSFYTSEYALDSSGMLQYNYNTKPLTISGEDFFVRSSGKFMATLIKDATGTTIGIHFDQQN